MKKVTDQKRIKESDNSGKKMTFFSTLVNILRKIFLKGWHLLRKYQVVCKKRTGENGWKLKILPLPPT